jgi:hypothetical protein
MNDGIEARLHLAHRKAREDAARDDVLAPGEVGVKAAAELEQPVNLPVPGDLSRRRTAYAAKES